MTSINDVAQWNGLFFGQTELFVAQLEGIVLTILIAVVGTLICGCIVKCFVPLRATTKQEAIGMDASMHGEQAYPSFNGFD